MGPFIEAHRINPTVTSFLYAPQTIGAGVSPAQAFSSARTMLRFKILVSAVPLLAAAILARIEFFPSPRPCIALGQDMLQIATAPWHADLRVSFTDDPALATVRVALADSPETADFAIVDDVDDRDAGTCEAAQATQFVAVTAAPSTAAAPVIYLAPAGPADFRIFVRSRKFTPREAAALIVGARGARPHLADASL
jgi:hypothetical protein